MRELSKYERIELRKLEIGGKRRERKREKHSDKFNKMFTFFFLIVRRNICDFCGSDVERDFDFIYNKNGVSAKTAFKQYENGEIEDYTIITRHPNIIKEVIKGKRGWGLWAEQWVDGIIDGCFTKYEILKQFQDKNIEMPDSYRIEFDNLIMRKIYGSDKDQDSIYLLDKEFKIKLYINDQQN